MFVLPEFHEHVIASHQGNETGIVGELNMETAEGKNMGVERKRECLLLVGISKQNPKVLLQTQQAIIYGTVFPIV